MSNIYDLQSGAQVTPAPLPAIGRRRQERILRVAEMWQEGARTSEIAQFFGLSRRQVQRDLVDARRLARAFVENFDSTVELGKEIAFLQRLRWLSMREFSLARFESTRVGALKLALEVSVRLTTLLQSVGLLARVPERVEITENPFRDDELRRRYVDILKEIRARGEVPPGM
jgi:hypothetical protein